MGNWTIQEDFKLLYLFLKHSRTSLKWHTIEQ
jgi:hypothetical protein